MLGLKKRDEAAASESQPRREVELETRAWDERATAFHSTRSVLSFHHPRSHTFLALCTHTQERGADMPARKKSNSVEQSDEEGDFEMVDSSSSKKTNNKKKQRSESVEVVEDSDEGDKSSSKSKKAAKKPASKKSKLALDEEEGEEDDVVNVDEEEGEEGDDDDVYTIEKILKHRMSEDTVSREEAVGQFDR